ncbi:MAG: hypothetical protein IJD64_02630 [Clostridia bacterium]|nr:hypothetical protein [Clostridia bacterium]
MEQKNLKFVSDLWVVTLRGEPRVVACRSPWERNAVGRRCSELLSEEELSRVSSALFSYETKPILSETGEGRLLIVLPLLMPSCTAAVVLVPQLDRQMTLRFLVKRSGMTFLLNEKLAEEAAGRMPGKIARYEKELASLLWEINTLSFSSLAPKIRGKEKRIDGFLWKKIEAISALTGCSVDMAPRCEVRDSETLDFGAFAHFLLVTFLLCRTVAIDRSAVVGWEKESVTVDFLCEKERAEGFLWELDVLESLAEEHIEHFGREYLEGRMHLSLNPRRIDVSYLGLKAENPLL